MSRLKAHNPVIDADIIDQAGPVDPRLQHFAGANVLTVFRAFQTFLCIFGHPHDRHRAFYKAIPNAAFLAPPDGVQSAGKESLYTG